MSIKFPSESVNQGCGLMDITQEEQQRKEFCDILFSLADSQIALKEKSERSRIYQRLEKLYYINGCEENHIPRI